MSSITSSKTKGGLYLFICFPPIIMSNDGNTDTLNLLKTFGSSQKRYCLAGALKFDMIACVFLCLGLSIGFIRFIMG